MKKLILTGLGFLFAVTMVFAQEVDVEQQAKDKVATLTEKLKLSDEQQASIYTIVLETKKAKYALKADTALSAENLQQQINTLKEGANTKISEQLNDEQKELFQKFITEGKKEEV